MFNTKPLIRLRESSGGAHEVCRDWALARIVDSTNRDKDQDREHAEEELCGWVNSFF